jgi:hypothetical protein
LKGSNRASRLPSGNGMANFMQQNAQGQQSKDGQTLGKELIFPCYYVVPESAPVTLQLQQSLQQENE